MSARSYTAQAALTGLVGHRADISLPPCPVDPRSRWGRRPSGGSRERDTLAPDPAEARQRVRIHHQLQDDPSRMADDAPGHLDELPPDRRDRVRRP